MPAMGTIRIGISGWTYAGWRGKFFPEKLSHKRELSYAASIFPSIEINGTFYSLQRPETFAKWAAATPDDFVFAVKGSRFITHVQRLKEVRAPLANFLPRAFCVLDRIGPFPLAASAQLQIRRQANRKLLQVAPARYGIRAGASPPSRQTRQRPRMDEIRRASPTAA